MARPDDRSIQAQQAAMPLVARLPDSRDDTCGQGCSIENGPPSSAPKVLRTSGHASICALRHSRRHYDSIQAHTFMRRVPSHLCSLQSRDRNATCVVTCQRSLPRYLPGRRNWSACTARCSPKHLPLRLVPEHELSAATTPARPRSWEVPCSSRILLTDRAYIAVHNVKLPQWNCPWHRNPPTPLPLTTKI
jgi:hypothetical protein